MAIGCREVIEALGSDGAREPSVREHLASCEDCRSAASAVEAVAATRAEPDPRALQGFAHRVRANWSRREERRSGPLRAAAVAAALAGAGAIALATHSGPPSPPPVPAPTVALPVAPDPSGFDDALEAEDDVLGDPFDDDAALDRLFDPDGDADVAI